MVGHWREVLPQSEIKGCVLVVHGAGEYSDRYLELANHLAAAGYMVGLGDLPGHGRSDGIRGHVDTFQQYVDTVARWAHTIQARYGDLPKFILGHSMGGLVTILYMAQQRDILWRGVLLSSPCLGVAVPAPKWQKQLAGFLEKWWPTLRFDNRIDVQWLCHNPQVIEKYDNDPLIVNKVSVRWFCELERAIQKVHDEVNQFQTPLFLMQGGEDYIVDPQATRHWYTQLMTQDKKLVWVEHGYHEMLQDFGKAELLKQMLDWIEVRI